MQTTHLQIQKRQETELIMTRMTARFLPTLILQIKYNIDCIQKTKQDINLMIYLFDKIWNK